MNNATNAPGSEGNSPGGSSSCSTPCNLRTSTSSTTGTYRGQRPSLERIASLSELPTPTSRSIYSSYHPDHEPHLWGHMLSSPTSAPSPKPLPARSATWTAGSEDKTRSRGNNWPRSSGGGKKTLEWACAKARTKKTGIAGEDDGASTEVEDEDVFGMGRIDRLPEEETTGGGFGAPVTVKRNVQAEMDAALALCGLFGADIPT